MAGEDEIIQKFRVQDDGAVQTLTNIDKKTQDMRTTTANLNSTVKEHGGSITQLGEKMVGLSGTHMNARHAVMLFSETTGVARGGIMTMMHAMMMMGPVVGAVVGGITLLKQHMDEEAEATKKATEAHEKYYQDIVRSEMVAGHSGGETAAHGKVVAAGVEAKRVQAEINEILREQKNLQEAGLELSVKEQKSLEEKQSSLIRTQAQIKMFQAEENAFAQMRLTGLAQDKLRFEYEMKLTNETKNKKDIMKEEEDLIYAQIQQQNVLMHALKDAGANQELQTEALKKQRDLRLELHKLKDAHKETTLSNAQMIEQEQQRISILQYKNRSDTHNAEFAQLQAHLSAQLFAHRNNQELQLLDKQEFNAQYAALVIKEKDEELSMTAQVKETMANVRGNQFEAERIQLAEWQRKELEMHKDQADKINEIYKLKGSDITRRQGQQFADTMQGYQNQITSATMGSAMAQIQGMQYEHEKKQAEYARVNTPEAKAEAAMENQAYAARIHEMQRESAHKLMGEQKVGFMDAGGAWEAFSRSLNQDPFKMEQRDLEIKANELLTSIDQKLGNKPVLVG